MPISSALGASALLPGSLGFRNVIINGAMVIDQRNAGASSTPSATTYTVDRWQYQCSVGSKMTVGQNLNSVTPPVGFTKYLGVQTGASANVTVGSTDFYCLNHYVEGYNSAQFGWGASTAKPVTLSFWVRSSIAGTHGVSFRNAGNNRSYPLSYTINAANTWEYKTLFVPGDVTGTWATDNTIGVFLSFNLGMGATYSGTSGAWAGAVYAAPSGAVKVVETNSATFYLTGVQLEQNYQPTPFEQRPYGVELQLCQRYYWKWIPSAIYAALQNAISASTTTVEGPLNHGYMRIAPSVDAYSTLSTNDAVAQNTAITAVDIPYKGNPVSLMRYTVGSAVLTTYRGYNILANNSTSAYLALTAEL